MPTPGIGKKNPNPLVFTTSLGSYKNALLLATLCSNGALKANTVSSEELQLIAERVFGPMLQDVLSEKVSQDEALRTELAQLLEDMGDSLTIIQRLGKSRLVWMFESMI